MTTGAQEFADEVAELRRIADDYRRMRAERVNELRRWRKARRELIDICVAHADAALLEAILTHLERTCCDWSRVPASRE